MERRSILALVIDDQKSAAMILKRNLDMIPDIEVEFIHCTNEQSGLKELNRGGIDITFLDHHLSESTTGLDILKSLRASGEIGAIIALTAQSDVNLAVELTRAGADDYLAQDDVTPGRLWQAIVRAETQMKTRAMQKESVEHHHLVARLSEQLAEANIELAAVGRIDSMTQLLNHTAWAEALELEHERSVRYTEPYSVLFLDVDHFKAYNDALGHPAGDECLRQIADCLRNTTRTVDMVGRYGGEEFVVLAPHTGMEEALKLAERIRDGVLQMAIKHTQSSVADHVTVSIGVAVGPEGPCTDVVKQADTALYAAKDGGRNRVCAAQTSRV